MGLFTQGPQNRKDEWAGLPSEPYQPEGVDVLGAAPATDPTNLGLDGLSLGGATGVSSVELGSIEIPMPSPQDTPAG